MASPEDLTYTSDQELGLSGSGTRHHDLATIGLTQSVGPIVRTYPNLPLAHKRRVGLGSDREGLIGFAHELGFDP